MLGALEHSDEAELMWRALCLAINSADQSWPEHGRKIVSTYVLTGAGWTSTSLISLIKRHVMVQAPSVEETAASDESECRRPASKMRVPDAWIASLLEQFSLSSEDSKTT